MGETATDHIHYYYNALAPDYDMSRFGNSYGRHIHKQENALLQKYLSEGLTLNLGCGTGRLMEYADYGIDISTAMLHEARSRFPGQQFVLCDAEETSFEDESFDQVFSTHLFMHLSKQKTAAIIQEAGRVLKKGGLFVFDFPSKKRRAFQKTSLPGWHAANTYSIKEIKQLTQDKWILRTYSGVMHLPIHRMPEWLRPDLLKFDTMLCRSFLKEYASYLFVVLEKK